jgi:thiamine-monophosphate kinase
MLTERTICEVLGAMLPQGRLNRTFESDAEIIELAGQRCLFTTDEFSAEDLFREDDPYGVGWNVAAGAISDILACGGVPVYYAHALTVDERWDLKYLRQFGRGVRAVLEATGARFIGGDCGRAAQWRCTASVIGRCEHPPVLRRGAAPGQPVYLSGNIGAGNLEAALRLFAGRGGGGVRPRPGRNRFALRLRESAIIRRYASACIDTSDGVASALDTLADLNGCGYAVADLPYLRRSVRFAAQTGLPKTLLFLGGCGEYELLFTVKAGAEAGLLADAKRCGCTFHRLGVMTSGRRVLREDGRELDLGPLRLEARDHETPQKYLEFLLQWLRKNAAPPEARRRIRNELA